MKIIVDTNIVFSALLNTNSRIGELLLNSEGLFDFYSCNLLREEIINHKAKLLKISGLSDRDLEESRYQIYSRIKFISEEIIPFEVWQKTNPIVRDVDMDDIAFVSLSEFMDARLWTGDKGLTKGLLAKGYDKLITTEGLVELKAELENKKKKG